MWVYGTADLLVRLGTTTDIKHAGDKAFQPKDEPLKLSFFAKNIDNGLKQGYKFLQGFENSRRVPSQAQRALIEWDSCDPSN